MAHDHSPTVPSSREDSHVSISSDGHTLEGEGTQSSSSRPTKRARRAVRDPERPRRERCSHACERCKAKKLKCLRSDVDGTECVTCLKAKATCVFEDVTSRPANARYLLALEARCAELEKALAAISPSHQETSDHYISHPAITVQSNSPPSHEHAQPECSTSRLNDQDASEHGRHDTSFSFLRLFKGSSRARRPNRAHPTDLGSVMQPSSPTDPSINPNPSLPPPQIANDLIETTYRHMQCRYPFIDWEQVRLWHTDRHRLSSVGSQSPLEDQIAAFFIWAIYAVGIQLAPHSGVDSAESYFNRAWKHLDAVMIPYDLTTVRALLLATFYAFRAPAGPSLWLLAGFTMRVCVELGLQHKSPASLNALQDQLRKRVFWSGYVFDRMVSHASGRPVSIPDASIDIEFPIDIDASITDPYLIAGSEASAAPERLTNMTSAIHSIKLYQLRSRIHGALTSTQGKPPPREVTLSLLSELESWKQAIPRAQGDGTVPMQAVNRFEWRYYHIVLLTLRPTILVATATDPVLSLCARAAAEALELDRTVHQGPIARQTSVSLCHTFICGSTLLYCLQINPNVIPQRLSSRSIRACSGTLAIYSQLFHEATPFYEIFEHMADEMLSEPAIGDDSRSKVVDALAAMLGGDFAQLASLYDTLKSHRIHDVGSVPTQNQTIPAPDNIPGSLLMVNPSAPQARPSEPTPLFADPMMGTADLNFDFLTGIQNEFQQGETGMGWEDIFNVSW